jgi:succinate-semialdehyde dehydrogenase/glutarate-semialdehyde dehydrogenase
MALVSVNPATGKEIERYEEHTADEVDRRLGLAVDAFQRRRATGFAERAAKMRRVADLLEERAREYGSIITMEMGKPISQATAEAEKCARGCRYYAEHAERFLEREVVDNDEGANIYVAFQPLGPILAIMPWNFPFWQVFRFAAPALMAGNVGLLKHASNASACALAIEELLGDAGFDHGEFQALLISSERVADVIDDDRIRAATLTGSVGAGRSVGSKAGKQIKPSVLELGGSDPFIVLADADLDMAAEIGVKARMQNTGQSCIAAKRFIVEDAVWEEFTERFEERVGDLKIGDPMKDSTDVGPLAREDLREDVHDQVRRSLEQGAKLLVGGENLDRPGFFYTPAVLVDVEPGNVAFEEEIFGPVASIIRVRDVDHAVELANATSFGLGGAVFTGDREKGEDVALRLEVGCAFVNEMVKSDPRVPFGGVKTSGYGRELSYFGIREFVNAKTVWIE